MPAYQDRDMRRNEKHHPDSTNGEKNILLSGSLKLENDRNLRCHTMISVRERYPKLFHQQALQPNRKSNLCMPFFCPLCHRLLKIEMNETIVHARNRFNLPFNVDGSGFTLSSSSNKSSAFIISSSSLSIFHTAATADLLAVLANDSLADEPTS